MSAVAKSAAVQCGLLCAIILLSVVWVIGGGWEGGGVPVSAFATGDGHKSKDVLTEPRFPRGNQIEMKNNRRVGHCFGCGSRSLSEDAVFKV